MILNAVREHSLTLLHTSALYNGRVVHAVPSLECSYHHSRRAHLYLPSVGALLLQIVISR